MSNTGIVEVVRRTSDFGERVAVVDSAGSTTYAELRSAAHGVATSLLGEAADLAEARVAFMVTPSARYVEVLWGIWLAGGMAVPLCLTHPAPELSHVLSTSGASVIVAEPGFSDILTPVATDLKIPLVFTDAIGGQKGPLPLADPDRRALMLFTSGTTGRPKGVVTSHRNVNEQIGVLVEAWGWSDSDRILLTLPLHHLHGILNVLSCALWSGAVCEMLPRFDPTATWERVASGDLTLYMGVPTIYHRLIQTWEQADLPTRERWSQGARGLRLMVSGSAALPVSVLERWKTLTGHILLERYGMTELGMALSNPLDGDRRPGFVGMPLPKVEVRLVDDAGIAVPLGEPGEIQVRGPNVFMEYWNSPDATVSAFTDEGWFRTGDTGQVEAGYYRILGRNSVDILKTGGEKVSALEIESVLLEHPAVQECAVVGVEDAEWGQRIVAAVVADAHEFHLDVELAGWCRERLAPFKVPKEFVSLESLPRNAMGKVQKPAVVALVT